MEEISHKHHYIPQFFLNNFGTKTNKGKYRINIFNKNTFQNYTNIVENIAYVKDFHTAEFENTKSDYFEKLHNERFEKDIHIVYKNLILKLNKYYNEVLCCYNCLNKPYYMKLYMLEETEKCFLSFLLAYFILRGKRIRNVQNKAISSSIEIMETLGKVHLLSENEIQRQIEKQLGTPKEIKNFQIAHPFMKDSINELASCLFLHKWNIVFNSTNTLFYTNDNAHSVTTLWKKQPIYKGIGYGSYGNLVIFPLTPKICVLMYDTPYVQEEKMNIIDKNIVLLSEKQIKRLNEDLAQDGIDEVYSYDGNWNCLKFLNN